MIVMVGVGWALRDSLPDHIVTREATPDRAGVSLSKPVAVAALPATLLLIAAIMVAATKLGNRLRPHVDPRLVASPDSQTRSMNTLFTLLPLFLIVLHSAFLLKVAGRDFQMEQTITVAFGVLLMGFGNVLPKITTLSASRKDAWGRWTLVWQRAQRGSGIAMVVLGAACIVAAFWIPPMLAAVTSAFLVAAIFAVMAVHAVSRR